MDNLTILIVGNQIFPEIINELKLFSKFKIKFYDDLNLCIKDIVYHDQLVIFFITEANKQYYEKINKNSFPLIVITKSLTFKNTLSGGLAEQLIMPFSILDLDKKIVIGTTGFSPKQEKYIKNISKFIPVLKAGNMSLGINVLIYLAELTSKSLGSKYLIKIVEEHHKHKKDYPSGTALMLGEGAAKGRGKSLKKIMGKKSLNKNNLPFGKKINFSSKRKGEIVGNHSVLFSNNMELISLTHNAHDRSLYSEGAIYAAQWLAKKRPGYYSMRDVLNI